MAWGIMEHASGGGDAPDGGDGVFIERGPAADHSLRSRPIRARRNLHMHGPVILRPRRYRMLGF